MRDAAATRKHILDVAFGEIFQHGFHAVSVNDIVAKTTVTKGAFFHHFPTKNELGYAIVDEVIREFMMERWIRPLVAYENPVEGILTQLKTIIETMPEDHLRLGCPLNNLMQEMSSEDPVFRERLNGVLTDWIDNVERELGRAQVNGFLQKTVDLHAAASFVVMSHEGAFGMSKGLRTKDVFWSLHRSLSQYFSSLS